MKRFYITLLSALMFCCSVHAQTRPQQSMYIFNPSFLNPAAIGAEDYGQIRTGYRKQWVGIDGAPATAWLNGEMRLGRKERSDAQQDPLSISKGHGLGFNLFYDEIGPYKTVNLNIGYSYHLPLSQGLTLSAGFAGGLQRTQFDISKSIYPDQPADPAVIAESNISKKYSPDLNAGVMLSSRNFFAGVSAMQILPSKFVEAQNSDSKYKTQFLGTAGYAFRLDEEGSGFWLSGVIKSDLANPVRYDLNAKIRYQTLGWIGASYRKDDAFGASLGLHITPSLSAGYMYEWGIDKRISSYSKGSHEICLGFRFLKDDEPVQPKLGW